MAGITETLKEIILPASMYEALEDAYRAELALRCPDTDNRIPWCSPAILAKGRENFIYKGYIFSCAKNQLKRKEI